MRNILELIDISPYTVKQFLAHIDRTPRALEQWRYGYCKPSGDKLDQICRLLDCTKEDLSLYD